MQFQTPLIIELNIEDEQVLGDVQVALSTDTYQGKLISAGVRIFK